jgi:hypothetical protein
MVLLFTTCEDRKRANPLDPDSELDPSEWAPSNLQAEVINDSEIKLTWTQEVEQISGFRIERKTGSGSFSQIAEIGKDTTEYTDTGLNFGTSYTYRVSAFTDDNESGYATSTTTNTSFPSPTNLIATPIDDQSIQLTWNDNCSFEDGYRLERSEDGVTFTQVAELGENITEYTNTGLNYGTDYTYRVKAFTDDNESGYATSTTTNTSFPSPTNLIATPIDDQSIQLTWTDNCSYEDGYIMERSEDGVSFTQIAELGENITEYTDTGLNYGTDYTYRVKAFTDDNESGYATSTSTTTSFPTPTNLTVTAIDDQSIQLTWTDNCSFEDGYIMERSEDGVSFTQITELGENVTEYTDTGLNYGTDYTFRVKAFTQQNESGFATSIEIQTIFPSPTDLVGTPIDDQSIQLTWTDNCSFEDGYKLERSEDGVSFTQIEELDTDVTEYTDTGLNFGTDYIYRVKAFRDDNVSGYSTSIGIQTVFPSPSDLIATPLNDTEIQLTWNDNCGFESGYRLDRSDGGSFTQIAELGANITEYTDTGLTLGTDYIYGVKAFTDDNESDYAGTTVHFWYDCNGEWGGSAIEDCNGDCDGTAIENECGCVGGNTGLEENFCFGCTDPAAMNYNPDALIDDGTCEYCPDSESTWNYYISEPDEGDVYYTGQTMLILYGGSTGYANCIVDLYRDGDYVTNITIDWDGVIYWDIPTDLTPSLLYQIKITSDINNNFYDWSDCFTIY